jgi:hypothetical protein
MDRRGFLKGLGVLAGASLIPDQILPATDFITSKVPADFGNKYYAGIDLFTNHMTIQRKTTSISGKSQSEVIFYTFANGVTGFTNGEKWNRESEGMGITLNGKDYIKLNFKNPTI